MQPVQTDVPRKDAAHAHWPSFTAMREALGGDRDVSRILIANNGLAAVKGIRSIQSWLYDHLGDAEAVKFEVMSTPEDLSVNAEFIRMAHHHTEVPGGSNLNNYANVDLIVSTALQQQCDAVYPGWGHASENPQLPRDLKNTEKCIFLGPSEEAMFALGDKIASSIIAQSLDVPTVPWSGDHIRVQPGTLTIDPETYKQAYVATEDECVTVVERVGLPVMLKASEGGGGKGIRKVYDLSEVRDHFRAIQEEVKNCHIFVMRMLENVRHLEVQLLADQHGQCIAVRTRDCSVQRRHQKIIEEGPVVGVDPAVVLDMERAAIRLAMAVGYCGLGTVEYMYNKDDNTYCFLELNPRIQVEHPVSELISGVNLPAALMCVGMGVPLHRIPEIRTYFGEDRYTDSKIDFKALEALPAKGHAIAVRITAEDVDNGFRPTSGNIDDISFRNSNDCWGYFSVTSGGGIHQYADSQFGHIFATGQNREEARRSMVLALRGITVRGEIRTSTAYVLELLEMAEFRDCDVNTAWLDKLIAERGVETSRDDDIHPALAAASILRTKRWLAANKDKYTSFFKAGHTPSSDFLAPHRTDAFVLQSTKYTVGCGRVAPNVFSLTLNGKAMRVKCREFTPGALQLTVGGKNIVAYCEIDTSSIRVTINGRALTFTGDSDPTKLRSAVPGRLVRYVVPDGEHVNEGAAYCEVEVMKMILPLKSAVAGTVHHRAVPGATIASGKLLADIDPDDPSTVARSQPCEKPWPAALDTAIESETGVEALDAVKSSRVAVEELTNIVAGFHDAALPLNDRVDSAIAKLSNIAAKTATIDAIASPAVAAAAELVDGTAGQDMATIKKAAVLTALIQQYSAVEKMFDGASRDDALTALRAACPTDDDEAAATAVDAAFEADFAHAATHRHQALHALLAAMVERDRPLMLACRPALEALDKMSLARDNGALLLLARSLVRMCSEPSFEERKAAMRAQLKDAPAASIAATSVALNVMCAALYDGEAQELSPSVLELLINRCHYGEACLSDLKVAPGAAGSDMEWSASWRVAPLHQCFADPTELSVDSPTAKSPAGTVKVRPGTGHLALFKDEAKMKAGLKAALLSAEIVAEQSMANALVLVGATAPTVEDLVTMCRSTMEGAAAEVVEKTRLERVTFCVVGSVRGPNLFTFNRSRGFFTEEDEMFRDCHPTTVNRLELQRFKNYNLRMYPASNRKVHIYYATPKVQTAANRLDRRLFVRSYFCPGDLGLAPWTAVTDVDCSRILTKVALAVELARADREIQATVYNHLFLNLIELTMDVKEVAQLLRVMARTFAARMFGLGFREVEIKFRTKGDDKNPSIPFRVFLCNHTTHALSVDVFVETEDADGNVQLRKARFEDDADNLLAGSGSTDDAQRWGAPRRSMQEVTSLEDVTAPEASVDISAPQEGAAPPREVAALQKRVAALKSMLPARVAEPYTATVPQPEHDCAAYATLTAAQLRRLQAQMASTTYVHDWSVLFEQALRKQWQAFVEARELSPAVVPSVPFAQTSLRFNADTKSLEPGSPTSGCGMVAWRGVVKTPAYFNEETKETDAREVIIVANDITTQSGSFAVTEDVVFQAASILAREEGLPFVYLSANSGARLGLCTEIKKCFKAEVTKDAMEYIYLTEEDYTRLTAEGVAVNVEEMTVGGAKRFKILDVIGNEKDFLGVENLQGSALTAGEMSLNYATIPTLSIVSGRSVGIGAYLVRLGRRVVQAKNSPIILTGATAINRLLGKEVYSSNNQLGGTQIMLPNGVSHWPAFDDLEAVKKCLQWLSFVPAKTEKSVCAPRALAQSVVDPIDRDVTFTPAPKEVYDPRSLINGTATETGMFDKNSWMEALSDWARTVVVGRATLGGLPCGVIVVETRATRKLDPADPADPTSSASEASQAGQVWFPDSARKTADALEDFHKERLPTFVLANWRGFSGGMRDMFDEVLKFGASIVDNLRVYDCPVFIYIPPFGELRGGAWVVVDPVINHNSCVSMFAADTARGGILEPSGIVEIKFRQPDVTELIKRNRPDVAALSGAELKSKIEELSPLYTDIATHFADLHDTPGRMLAKKCIDAVVPWKDARRVFHKKLQAKLCEIEAGQALVAAGAAADLNAAIQTVAALRRDAGVAVGDDAASYAWATSAAGKAAVEGTAAKAKAASVAAAMADVDVAALCAALSPEKAAALKKALA